MKQVILIVIIFPNVALAFCTEISNVCVEGPETRMVSGKEFYRDCWKYEIKHECYSETEIIDNCAGIAEQGLNCEQLNSVCVLTSPTGKCLEYSNKYVCTESYDYEFLNFINSEKYIKSEQVNDEQCAEYENGLCSFQTESCISGAETKEIDGLEVSRDCWEYQRNYECGGDFTSHNCAEFEDVCQLGSETCISHADNGVCSHYEKIYNCPQSTSGSLISLDCSAQTYCIGDNCTTIESPTESNFHQAATTLHALEEAAAELDEDGVSTFSGEGLGCSKSPFGFSNCCKDSGWGNEAQLASCSSNELKLIEKQKAKMCHYVGSYCSKEVPLTGVCLEKSYTYCCFSGKLSRIIHQQGRPQLGIGWGHAEGPNCRGLTIEELQQIDFGEVDFSEFYEDLEQQTTLPDTEANLEVMEERITDYYEQFENEDE